MHARTHTHTHAHAHAHTHAHTHTHTHVIFQESVNAVSSNNLYMFVGLICSDILLFLVWVLVPFVRGYESKFNECVEWRKVTGVGWGGGRVSWEEGGREEEIGKSASEEIGKSASAWPHSPPPEQVLCAVNMIPVFVPFRQKVASFAVYSLPPVSPHHQCFFDFFPLSLFYLFHNNCN